MGIRPGISLQLLISFILLIKCIYAEILSAFYQIQLRMISFSSRKFDQDFGYSVGSELYYCIKHLNSVILFALLIITCFHYPENHFIYTEIIKCAFQKLLYKSNTSVLLRQNDV